jgi:hypothetical protein
MGKEKRQDGENETSYHNTNKSISLLIVGVLF